LRKDRPKLWWIPRVLLGGVSSISTRCTRAAPGFNSLYLPTRARRRGGLATEATAGSRCSGGGPNTPPPLRHRNSLSCLCHYVSVLHGGTGPGVGGTIFRVRFRMHSLRATLCQPKGNKCTVFRCDDRNEKKVPGSPTTPGKGVRHLTKGG